MRRIPHLTWYRLRWPRVVELSQLEGLSRALAASGATPIVIEALGGAGMVVHRLAVPIHCSRFIADQLHGALPGLVLEAGDPPSAVRFDLTLELRLSTGRRSLAFPESAEISRRVLIALGSVGEEQTLLQWVLLRAAPPAVVPNRAQLGHESRLRAVLSAPLGPPPPLDAEARSALKVKRSEPGWRALGRIAVKAGTEGRARTLAEQLLGALRSAEAPGVQIRARAIPPTALDGVLRQRSQTLLNVRELLAVSAWPVGQTAQFPVSRTRARTLAAAKAVPSRGRVIGEATSPRRRAPVALNESDAFRHLHVLGPTGVGKSTLLLNLIVQDLVAGRGLVVVEPKGDLIAEVLARITASRVGDVVLLDPTDREAVVGLNPLASRSRSPELAADQLLAVFHGLYAASWGPRTQDILHASLLTLARRPGSTLVELPLLLNDPAFRRRVVGRVDEPVVLQPFWAGFEAWSEAQRTEAIAPVMNKVRPFLMRSNLRAVLGQAEPRFDVRQVFTERKILLVNLAKGVMGSEAAALLGSLVVAQLWQATLERSRVEPARRHPVFVYIDEFQDYLHLPTDLADALAEARGLGVGLTLAHQHLHQLRPEMRSAVQANARSRVCFQLAPEDARLIAGGSPGIDADDLQNLDAFEVYAQLVAEGAVQPWLSARTRPAPPPTSTPAAVIRQSRERYGRSRSEVDQAISAVRRPDTPAGDIGVRRSNGGAE